MNQSANTGDHMKGVLLGGVSFVSHATFQLLPTVYVPSQIWIGGEPVSGVCTCGKTLMVVMDSYNGPRRFRCPDPVSTGCAF
jgi:hypothetical protein